MIKLLKYLKPFILLLLISVALLFVQAFTDLSLPDYMSSIVNVGIQQSGNQDQVPKYIEKSVLEGLIELTDESEREGLTSAYQIIPEASNKYKTIVKDYKLIKGPLYEYIGQGNSNIEKIIIKGMLKFQMLNQEFEMMKDDLNLVDLESTTMTWFKELPDTEKDLIISRMDAGLENMDDMILNQSGIKATTLLYESMGRDLSALRTSYILSRGGWMLLLALIGATASIIVGFLAAKIAAGLGRNLRKKLFHKITYFSKMEFDKFSTASLITRSTNDVMQVQNLMTIMIRMIVYAPIMAIGGIFKAVENNSSMTWIIALAVGIIILAIAVVFSIAMPKFKLVQKLVDKVNQVMRENLTGMMVIRAFNTEDFEAKRFDDANQDLTDTNLFVNRIMVFLMPFMNFVMNGVMILILWVGAKEISQANMQVGDMMAFIQYAMQIIMAFLMMSMMFIMIPRASVAAGRIVEILETPYQIQDPKNPEAIADHVKGHVIFDQVNFKYPGAEENILKNISFEAVPGQMTAIIGSTGSGKTSLVNLIPRLYEVNSGQILIDGQPIQSIKQHDLRSMIGYMPQKAALFSGTVDSNLMFGNPKATKEEKYEALAIAQCESFISLDEEGLLKEVSQDASNFSGGQKQRLSIARALVKNPQIYIFDDSFSALDFKTDLALRKAIKNEAKAQTIIVVAQRISTIKDAEQIIVLEEGKIVGKGSHDALMKDCETYKEIAYSQLSKEELA